MKEYGIDCVRGGNWNMADEGVQDAWWVPKHLRGTPCFTEKWLSLSEHKFALSAESDRVLSEVLSLL